jgi:hypothetical protein
MEITQEYLDCQLEKANKCFADKTYKMMLAKSQGDTPRYKKLFKQTKMIWVMIQSICCFNVEETGNSLTQEQATNVLNNLQKLCTCNC